MACGCETKYLSSVRKYVAWNSGLGSNIKVWCSIQKFEIADIKTKTVTSVVTYI